MTEEEKNKVLKIAEQTNYKNKSIEYLKNVSIVEYDIRSAGFSVLKFLKLLPEETLQEWEKLDKKTRTIKEGLLQKKNPQIAEKIISTLAKVRKAFVLLNNIKAEDILSIKKDAIFVVNKIPKNLIIQDFFEFRKKGEYSSYLFVNNSEFYYDPVADVLDVKGISNIAKEEQKNYFLKDLSNILKMGEKLQVEQLFFILRNYREKYLDKRLPIETYRSLKDGLFSLGKYRAENLNEEFLQEIHIEENYINYLLPIFSILL